MPRRAVGYRGTIPPDESRMVELDRVCALAGARDRSRLGVPAERMYRDNLIPAAVIASLHRMADSYTCNIRTIVRCAAMGLAERIEARIPTMVALGYFPVERIQHYVPTDSVTWRRFAALCEECHSSWDEVERNDVGKTITCFTDDELREIDRATSAYGISRQRFVTIAVINLVRTWERSETDGGTAEGHEVDGGK